MREWLWCGKILALQPGLALSRLRLRVESAQWRPHNFWLRFFPARITLVGWNKTWPKC
jgi:hypothetical protein